MNADQWADEHPNPMLGPAKTASEGSRPVKAKRLRELLTYVEDNPSLLDVTTYGEHRPSGIAADLAGWTLLLSGWTLVGDHTFRSPDSRRIPAHTCVWHCWCEDGKPKSREISRGEDIEREACAALGLTEDELWDGGDFDTLFTLGADAAVKRLRELTEQAEAAVANA